MNYRFSQEKFKENFKADDTKSKSADSLRLKHKQNNQFKLFPFKITDSKKAPIVTELEDVVCGFFRNVSNKKMETIEFDALCLELSEELEIDENDLDYFKDMIQNIFFAGDKFIADNFGLYPYQTALNNKSEESLAHFLFSIFGMNELDCQRIVNVKERYRFNVLEEMVIKAIEAKKVPEADKKDPYFVIKTDLQNRFKDDFYFMLETEMTSLEDLANLFAIYYFYYVSQTCIILDHFCTGKREGEVKLYYALDWEKVSKNRLCCEEGWGKLQWGISHMCSHAITLEVLNQTLDGKMYDYISFGEMAKESAEADAAIAEEIKRAESVYCSYIGDYKGFANIPFKPSSSETEKAIKHLYHCIESQFLNTDRKSANQKYNEKFSGFCKSRWLKDRKKSGFVLNLTERDIIFLTKICLRNKEKIRLNDLFAEYGRRGIYLDGTSKEYLQDFFTNLNLIEKKSDSGDAQYVKRIL